MKTGIFEVSDKDYNNLLRQYDILHAQFANIPPDMLKEVLKAFNLTDTSLESFEAFAGWLIMAQIKEFQEFTTKMKARKK